VAQALNVALGDSAKRELAARPTENLPAYDAFLRGEAAAAQETGVFFPNAASLRQAIVAYEQAVALDSSFVLAWAQLARAQAGLYYYVPIPAMGEAARSAAVRVRALAPNRPEGHQAMAAYYSNVLRDPARAYIEDSTAFALAPGNAEVLGALGFDELSLGRWDAARGHLEQAVRLDPRSARAAQGLGDLLLCTRHYPEAEQALDHALRLAPASLGLRNERALVALAQGDLAKAQTIIKAAAKEVDPTALVAHMAMYQDLMWVLDEAQLLLLLRLRPSAFDDNRGTWGLVLAQSYALRGNQAEARLYADSARLAYQQQLQASPQDASLHAELGLALAYLGQKAVAIREGERAVALLPITKDAFLGPYIQHQLVRIYMLVGEPERALDQLEPLLKIPYYLSPGWLKIDPNFDPLRSNPRFERLVNGTS
jgi:tetratricopeptide (TPR) repeat protein